MCETKDSRKIEFVFDNLRTPTPWLVLNSPKGKTVTVIDGDIDAEAMRRGILKSIHDTPSEIVVLLHVSATYWPFLVCRSCTDDYMTNERVIIVTTEKREDAVNALGEFIKLQKYLQFLDRVHKCDVHDDFEGERLEGSAEPDWIGNI